MAVPSTALTQGSDTLARRARRRPLPRRLAELLVATLEAGGVRQVDWAAGQVDLLAVDLLEAHDEHRAV